MGVIIAVTIWPKGAGFVVIPERYPLPGALSRRLTVGLVRNPATPRPRRGRGQGARGPRGRTPQGGGGGRGGACSAGERGDSGAAPPARLRGADVSSGVPTSAPFT